MNLLPVLMVALIPWHFCFEWSEHRRVVGTQHVCLLSFMARICNFLAIHIHNPWDCSGYLEELPLKAPGIWLNAIQKLNPVLREASSVLGATQTSLEYAFIMILRDLCQLIVAPCSCFFLWFFSFRSVEVQLQFWGSHSWPTHEQLRCFSQNSLDSCPMLASWQFGPWVQVWMPIIQRQSGLFMFQLAVNYACGSGVTCTGFIVMNRRSSGITATDTLLWSISCDSRVKT